MNNVVPFAPLTAEKQIAQPDMPEEQRLNKDLLTATVTLLDAMDALEAHYAHAGRANNIQIGLWHARPDLESAARSLASDLAADGVTS